MAEGQHTDDLRNVREGDTVEITTTEGETFETECISYSKEHADPRSGEIRETKIWQFDTSMGTVVVNILDGLKSSPDDPEFPDHGQLWNLDENEGLGYIETLK